MDSYYSWYQSKASISSQLADLCRPSLLEAVHCIDRSDYSSIDGKLPADRGVVIALPHHGHYILSAVRLMEHIRHLRVTSTSSMATQRTMQATNCSTTCTTGSSITPDAARASSTRMPEG